MKRQKGPYYIPIKQQQRIQKTPSKNWNFLGYRWNPNVLSSNSLELNREALKLLHKERASAHQLSQFIGKLECSLLGYLGRSFLLPVSTMGPAKRVSQGGQQSSFPVSASQGGTELYSQCSPSHSGCGLWGET